MLFIISIIEMIIDFIKLRLRETTRSVAWNKNLITNILLGLAMLYVTGAFIFLGFILDRMILRFFPDCNPVVLLNGLLLYYFGFELLIRFLMQQTPSMSITPFLHLPVRRSFLIQSLLARSMVNPFNYISLLIFIPFAIRAVSILYSGVAACLWILMLFLLIVIVVGVCVYIKRQMAVNPIVSLCCVLVFLALIASDIWGIFSLSDISATIFGAILAQPLWILAPITLVLAPFIIYGRDSSTVNEWNSPK